MFRAVVIAAACYAFVFVGGIGAANSTPQPFPLLLVLQPTSELTAGKPAVYNITIIYTGNIALSKMNLNVGPFKPLNKDPAFIRDQSGGWTTHLERIRPNLTIRFPIKVMVTTRPHSTAVITGTLSAKGVPGQYHVQVQVPVK